MINLLKKIITLIVKINKSRRHKSKCLFTIGIDPANNKVDGKTISVKVFNEENVKVVDLLFYRPRNQRKILEEVHQYLQALWSFSKTPDPLEYFKS